MFGVVHSAARLGQLAENALWMALCRRRHRRLGICDRVSQAKTNRAEIGNCLRGLCGNAKPHQSLSSHGPSRFGCRQSGSLALARRLGIWYARAGPRYLVLSESAHTGIVFDEAVCVRLRNDESRRCLKRNEEAKSQDR